MDILLAYENSLSRAFAGQHLAVADREMNIITAASFAESLKIANECGSLDVVVFDLEMQDINGIHSLRDFKEKCHHDVHIAATGVKLTRGADREIIKAGGVGFLPYHMSVDALVGVLRLIGAGEIYFPTNMGMNTSSFADRVLSDSGNNFRLTARESDVLAGLRAGLSNKEMAEMLVLSEVTVKYHIKSLRGKLGARNRVHAVCRAIELQID
ncbi:response regulator transcription factor [SAR116 cluster bacterium]|nr:response regulator transcription factor [SAR116 cluster bacterium]